MNAWEKKIVNAFIDHYFASAGESGEGRSTLRIHSSVLFPGFDKVATDEKLSYLEAAESLERKGLVKLNWEKRGKGERLKTISCENFEKLFEETGSPYPKTEAEKIRAMLCEKVIELKVSSQEITGTSNEKITGLLEFLSLNFGPREIGQGICKQAMEDFIRLMEFLLEPSRLEKITTRALSILLYHNSKRLENLLALFTPLLFRAQKTIPVPDFSFLERSYPEIMFSGKIIIEFKNSKIPLVNTEGHLLGLPLETIEEIVSIRLITEKKEKTVLTIENKETFYALGTPQKSVLYKNLARYDCFLYIGGYSNRAAALLIKTLAASDFSFYHAGDLDPDGVLILQHIKNIAERPVTPVRMDAETFKHYQPWARSLTKPMLRQIKKIREETIAIPELADLLHCIEETGLGVEQEIIDYR